jgi:hypothetical protein
MTTPQLAQLLLRLCPDGWKNVWRMLGKGQPQDFKEMIKFMEQQFSQDTLQKSKSAKVKSQHDGNNKGNKKLKGDSNHNNGSKRTKKHCALCKEHGKKRGKSNSNGDKKTQKNYAPQLKSVREDYKECKKEHKSLRKRLNEEHSDSDPDA